METKVGGWEVGGAQPSGSRSMEINTLYPSCAFYMASPGNGMYCLVTPSDSPFASLLLKTHHAFSCIPPFVSPFPFAYNALTYSTTNLCVPSKALLETLPFDIFPSPTWTNLITSTCVASIALTWWKVQELNCLTFSYSGKYSSDYWEQSNKQNSCFTIAYILPWETRQ